MEPANIHILVLDRDAASARVIRDVLAKIGYKVSVASHESDALNLASGELFNVVIKSFDARRIDAVALMEKVRGITPDSQFIFISEGGTIHTAVEAMRKGAFDYHLEAHLAGAAPRVRAQGARSSVARGRGPADQAAPAPPLGPRHLRRQQRCHA
jgi:DNA-binding NtrC family response regulator